ncbi:hypothetical protein FIBSPDRAFT_850918, partial [Athelia psychrophila]
RFGRAGVLEADIPDENGSGWEGWVASSTAITLCTCRVTAVALNNLQSSLFSGVKDQDGCEGIRVNGRKLS